MSLSALFAILLATIFPLLFLYMIRTLDLYETDSLEAIMISVAWGMVCVPLAANLNGLFVVDEASRIWVMRYVAPFTEEILKAIIFLYLIRRADFTYFVDGAIYGFAIGIGFAVAENYLYLFLDSGQTSLELALTRVLSTNLMHAVATGLIGIVIGWARINRFSRRFIALIVGTMLAFLFHMGFNNMVLLSSSPYLFFYAVFGSFIGLLLIIYAINRGLAEEKGWIEGELNSVIGITHNEITAVQELNHIDELLKPLAKILGYEKIDQIETFLHLEARIGILQKTKHNLSDEQMRHNIEVELASLNKDMHIVRQEIGTYGMLYLRNIFPENHHLWESFENSIKMRLEVPEQNKFDMFAIMGERSAGLPTEGHNTI